MKKILPFVLTALAGYLLVRWLLPMLAGGGGTSPAAGGSGPSGGVFGGGNQQLQQVGKNLSDWWFYQTHQGPQRNNPVTGNPIPGATIYPGEPGGWMNA